MTWAARAIAIRSMVYRSHHDHRLVDGADGPIPGRGQERLQTADFESDF